MDSAIARPQLSFEWLVVFGEYLAAKIVNHNKRTIGVRVSHTVLKLISPFAVSRRTLARVEFPDRNATSTVIGPLNDVRERLCLFPVDGGGARSASGTFKSVSTTQVPLIDPFTWCMEMKFEAGVKGAGGDCLEIASVYDGGNTVSLGRGSWTLFL